MREDKGRKKIKKKRKTARKIGKKDYRKLDKKRLA